MSLSHAPQILAVGLGTTLIVVLLWKAFYQDAEQSDEATTLRKQLDEAHASLIEQQHESDYWRGLANWYGEHTSQHPSASECDRIATQCDKYLFVGTKGNPLLTQHDGPAIYADVTEFATHVVEAE